MCSILRNITVALPRIIHELIKVVIKKKRVTKDICFHQHLFNNLNIEMKCKQEQNKIIKEIYVNINMFLYVKLLCLNWYNKTQIQLFLPWYQKAR